MFLVCSSGRLNYHWYLRSKYYRTFSSARRALNEKCTTTKLCSIYGNCFYPKSFNYLFSNSVKFERFRKQISKNLKLLKDELYSQGKNNPKGLIILIIIICLASGISKDLFYNSLDWEEFVNNFLLKGEVEKVVVINDKKGLVFVKDDSTRKPFHKFYLLNVENIQTFEDDLTDLENSMGIDVNDRIPIVRLYQYSLPTLVSALITLVLLRLFFSSPGKISPFARFKKAKFTLIDPLTGDTKGVKFSDVAGLKEAKQEIMEFVDYLKRPEHYQELGAKVPKGALLLGPPGCGKTLLAKAVASEANVPFLSTNGSEFIELVGGLGAARVRNLFSEARKISPCIIYIDEIDTIGRKRTDVFRSGNSESELTLNQLLVEMDGMASREGVLTLASTNRAEILDKALLRPGRFDRHIMIDLPNAEERQEIFLQYLSRIRLEHPPEWYAKRLASLTPGVSGADIANICNEAALYAARFKNKVVTGKDLDYAVDKTSRGVKKSSNVLTAEEKKMIAYNEAGRALVGWLSDGGEILIKISIVPRTNQSMALSQFSQPEKFLLTQEELFDKMCTSLGGTAAEVLIFNVISTKSERDLKKITNIAYATVSQYGMNNIIGPISFGPKDASKRKPYSKQLSALMDEEVTKLVSKAFKQAQDILRDNKNLLIKLAEELRKRETLIYEDVEALIGPPKNPKKKIVESQFLDMAINTAA